MDIEVLLHEFMSSSLPIKVYNEVSLQLELGVFLRNKLYGTPYDVLFEKNVYDYIPNRSIEHFVKSEIDVVIENEFTGERYAIELKFPRNGMHPEEMFEFLKDVSFMEQCKQSGIFSLTYCLTLVDDHLFYEGNNNKYPYYIFRNQTIAIRAGLGVERPTGKQKGVIVSTITDNYHTEWLKPSASWLNEIDRYYVIAI